MGNLEKIHKDDSDSSEKLSKISLQQRLNDDKERVKKIGYFFLGELDEIKKDLDRAKDEKELNRKIRKLSGTERRLSKISDFQNMLLDHKDSKGRKLSQQFLYSLSNYFEKKSPLKLIDFEYGEYKRSMTIDIFRAVGDKSTVKSMTEGHRYNFWVVDQGNIDEKKKFVEEKINEDLDKLLNLQDMCTENGVISVEDWKLEIGIWPLGRLIALKDFKDSLENYNPNNVPADPIKSLGNYK